MFTPVRTVAPAATPVSLAEAKAHLRVDHGDEDALITSLIAAATDHLDGWSGVLGRALVTQTWRQDFPSWADALRLPLAPVQSAVVAYDDENGDEQTLSSGWSLLTDARGSYIARNAGVEWPRLGNAPASVRVTFVAGYGAAAAVPAPIKSAILLIVGGLYQNREDKVRGVAENQAVSALLTPYRRVSF